jgi:surfeit locus 1 family protein
VSRDFDTTRSSRSTPSGSAVRRNLKSVVHALAAVSVFATLISLGLWQLDRAQEKHLRAENYVRRLAETRIDLGIWGAAEADELRWRRITMTGRFTAPVLLLDNRIMMGKSGVEVLSPFVLDDGRTVLVNRGWVATEADRRKVPALETPEHRLTLAGHVGPPPVTGLKFNDEADAIEIFSPNISRIQNVDFAAI